MEKRIDRAFSLINDLSGSNSFQKINATVEERAAICIQKCWRGYRQRKRYLKDLNEAFFEEDERRVEEMLAQVEFLENDLEDQYLLAELDELDFISRNFERRRQNAATVIQRFWRQRKKVENMTK